MTWVLSPADLRGTLFPERDLPRGYRTVTTRAPWHLPPPTGRHKGLGLSRETVSVASMSSRTGETRCGQQTALVGQIKSSDDRRKSPASGAEMQAVKAFYVMLFTQFQGA